MPCRATANDIVFEDTRERGKPIVFLYGGRPFTGGLCKGVEEAMASMRAGQLCTLSLHCGSWITEKLHDRTAGHMHSCMNRQAQDWANA